MPKPKLFQLLASFNKADWINAKRHIIAQNRSDSELPQLYVILWENKLMIQSGQSIDQIWKSDFQHHSRKSFMNLMSRLYADLLIWVGSDAISKSKWESEIWIVKGLNDRGLYHAANKHFESIQKSIKDTKGADTQKADISARLNHFQIYTDNPYKYTKVGQIYKALIQTKICAFIDQILLYEIELTNIAKLKKFNFEDEFALISSFSQLKLQSENSPELHMLSEIVMDSNTTNYFKLYDKLLEGHFRTQSELHVLVTLYLIYKGLTLNVKTSVNKSYLLELYAHALKTEILMTQGKIPIMRFHNMITSLSVYNTYKHTDEFILRWAPKVNTHHIESTTNVAHAINCFYHERYSEIPQYTRDVSYEVISTKARALCLEIISLYHDRGEYLNDCLRQITNYKRFLLRNKKKLSARFHLGMANQIKMIEKLLKHDRNDKIDLDTSKVGYLFHQKWTNNEIKKRQPK